MIPSPIRSILIATDLRAESAAVLEGAAALAHRFGAALHVVHAVEFLTVPYSAVSAADDYRRKLLDAQVRLQQAVEDLPSGISRPATQEVLEESTPRAILDRASEVQADLIVIGPARPHTFAWGLRGSTADRLLSSAEIPVLVMAGRPPLEVQRVMVPINLADPARGALDQGIAWASAAARSSGAEPAGVEVLYVIPRRYERAGESFVEVVLTPQLTLEVEDARERMRPFPPVQIETATVWGDDAAEEIVARIEVSPPDLLVLGTHGYGTIGRALLGSVTSQVVRRATCPMLLVPPALWARELG